MSVGDFWLAVERIRERDSRYARDAYAFVMDGLDHTVSALEERRHVTARELLYGLCAFAREKFGMMAFDVLRSWGITAGSDVGEIVFHLIDAGILSRREEDTREDFDTPLDFKQALEDSYFDLSDAPGAPGFEL